MDVEPENTENSPDPSKDARPSKDLSNLRGPKAFRSKFESLSDEFSGRVKKDWDIQNEERSIVEIVYSNHLDSVLAIRALREYYGSFSPETSRVMSNRMFEFDIGPIDLLLFSTDDSKVPLIVTSLQTLDLESQNLFSAIAFAGLEMLQAAKILHSEDIEIRKALEITIGFIECCKQLGIHEPIGYLKFTEELVSFDKEDDLISMFAIKALFSTDCRRTGHSIAQLIIVNELDMEGAGLSILTQEVERMAKIREKLFKL